MYIDILPNDNVDLPTMATFKETAVGRTINALKLHLDDGEQWCAITGWSEAGAVAARFTPIEESGDGPGRLVSGGDHGLRLQRISGPEAATAVIWDVLDKAQWGEPFLLCLPGTETISAELTGGVE